MTNLQFKEIINQATDLVHIVTPDGLILFANDSWKRALQYSPEEVIGKPIYSFIHSDKVEEFRTFRSTLLQNKEVHKAIETVFATKSGSLLQVEGYMSCHTIDEHVIYSHSIFRDVTARKQQESLMREMYARVAEREQNFNQLIEYAPDAIIVIDEKSQIKLWNPKCEQLFGWSFDEVRDRLLSEIIIPFQYRQKHYDGMHRFLRTGEATVMNRTIEITALRRDQHEFNISLTISKAVLQGHHVFIGFIRDITEQKMMAFEIETRKRELEATNIELAQYAAIASHDLKEPIRKILLFCGLLADQVQNNAAFQKELVQKIYSSATRMAALLDSVNKFSLITPLAIPKEAIHLNGIISEIIDDLEFEINKRDAIIEVGILPNLSMHKIHLYQLFHNLLSNAIKYSRPGVITLISITSNEDNQKVHINVTDNGLGFSNDFTNKMFEPFQRLHGKNHEGTGIGLSICKKIVELYKGSIKSSGVVDQGSVFTVTLPVHLIQRNNET